MRHEKIFKRDDGSRVKVISELYLPFLGKHQWKQTVYVCPPRKRTFVNVQDDDDYVWRGLDSDGRKQYTLKNQLQVVSSEEILSVHSELWNLIKPQTTTI